MAPAHTLLLTPWFSPHKVLTWEKAISMLYTGDVEVLQEYEDTIRSPSISMKMPAVVRLKRHLGNTKRGIKFSRQNLLARDGYRCQYCGAKKGAHELNYDHVVPRAQGGKTDWSNIVMACYACNTRKGGRTPEQAGMRLIARPVKPKTLPLAGVAIDPRKVHPAWESWIPTA